MKIFISYSRTDEPQVVHLFNDLKDVGHQVWLDHELHGGQDWWDNILRQIRECDLFLFALTPSWLASDPCQREYQYAQGTLRNVLPIKTRALDIRSIPEEVQKLQIVEYRPNNANDLKKLIKAINLLPAPRPLPQPLPVPPPAPISPLAGLQSQIKAPSLTEDEQYSLIRKLRAHVDSPIEGDSARKLLLELRNREDIFLATANDIDGILKSPKPYSGPKTGTNNSSLSQLFAGNNALIWISIGVVGFIFLCCIAAICVSSVNGGGSTNCYPYTYC